MCVTISTRTAGSVLELARRNGGSLFTPVSGVVANGA